MAQIGTIELKTESGIKEVPVFDTGDVDYDFVRVQTENGTGALNLVPKADADIDELRVNTSSQGVLAVSTSTSAGDLTATATVPTDTTAKVTVYEDTTGNGTADNVETVTIQDGENGYPLDNISLSSGNEYWLSIELSNTDIEKTAKIDSVKLAV